MHTFELQITHYSKIPWSSISESKGKNRITAELFSRKFWNKHFCFVNFYMLWRHFFPLIFIFLFVLVLSSICSFLYFLKVKTLIIDIKPLFSLILSFKVINFPLRDTLGAHHNITVLFHSHSVQNVFWFFLWFLIQIMSDLKMGYLICKYMEISLEF